ncbi:MAG: universal stress protein [Puniceicoccaceae bacterium]
MKGILVCTDGSHYASEALRYSGWVAARSAKPVTALYASDLRQFQLPAILDLSGSLGIQPYQQAIDILHHVENEKIKFIRTMAEESFRRFGPQDGRFEARTGSLSDTVIEFEDSCDLLVLGKRGEGSEFASEHLGSTLERVLRQVDLPCLVGNREFHEIKRVAFAFDGGKSCLAGIEYLKEHRWLKDLPIQILVVAESESETDWAVEQMQQAEQTLVGCGYQVGSEMLNGLVEDALSKYVASEGIDLLLIGAHGHSRIRRLIIGSTTTEVLRRCRVPILCFR